MQVRKLVLLKQLVANPVVASDTLLADMDMVKSWVKDRSIFSRLLRYAEAEGLTYHLDILAKPLAFALLLRAFSHGRCSIRDPFGHVQPVTAAYILQRVGEWIQDALRKPKFLRNIQHEVDQLLAPEQGPHEAALQWANRPVYLRTDLTYGLQSGGSVGHIAGVLNHLDEFSGKPIFITSDEIPTVRCEIERIQVWPDRHFREFPDVRYLAFNQTFYGRALDALRGQPVSFIYQRYSLNNFAGLQLARTLRVPLILEFNGSEVWVHRNWGGGLAHAAIAEQIEMTNLAGAHLIVVVSQVIKEDLVARGIPPARVLVNPNGVEPEQYSPQIDGSELRQRYGLNGKIVLGFIGSFGRWHGAEVLADAFGRLLRQVPSYRKNVRLLLIGNGMTMPQVRTTLQQSGATDYAILTGTVPQAQGPAHLAACDILISPHVPNPDGTRFFGSPTKLFEYMAMGKGIVASDLDQIGEILAHGQTAWLVEPGNPDALVAGMRHLIEDPPLAQRLGEQARREVVQHYTWRAHTKKIIDKLSELCMTPRPHP